MSTIKLTDRVTAMLTETGAHALLAVVTATHTIAAGNKPVRRNRSSSASPAISRRA